MDPETDCVFRPCPWGLYPCLWFILSSVLSRLLTSPSLNLLTSFVSSFPASHEQSSFAFLWPLGCKASPHPDIVGLVTADWSLSDHDQNIYPASLGICNHGVKSADIWLTTLLLRDCSISINLICKMALEGSIHSIRLFYFMEYLFTFLCVCVCVSYTYLCKPACTQEEIRRGCQVFSSVTPIFSSRNLRLTLFSPAHLETRKPKKSSCLCPAETWHYKLLLGAVVTNMNKRPNLLCGFGILTSYLKILKQTVWPTRSLLQSYGTHFIVKTLHVCWNLKNIFAQNIDYRKRLLICFPAAQT